MTGDLTADEICSLLQLEPNATCGFVRVTFGSKLPIAAGGLPAPFAEARPLGSALYFLVTPGAPVRLHRIRNDQLYHYYLGDPLEAFLLHADGTTERVVVGPDLRGGQQVQLLIPGNTFHTARKKYLDFDISEKDYRAALPRGPRPVEAAQRKARPAGAPHRQPKISRSQTHDFAPLAPFPNGFLSHDRRVRDCWPACSLDGPA